MVKPIASDAAQLARDRADRQTGGLTLSRKLGEVLVIRDPVTLKVMARLTVAEIEPSKVRIRTHAPGLLIDREETVTPNQENMT